MSAVVAFVIGSSVLAVTPLTAAAVTLPATAAPAPAVVSSAAVTATGSASSASVGKQTSTRPPFDVVPPVGRVTSVAVKATPPVRGFDANYSKAIDSYTTARRQVFQNADGTQTEVVAAAPVRFKAADGTWRGIDLSLVADPDGSLRPRSAATVPHLSLSQGAPQAVLPTSAGDITFTHVAMSAVAATGVPNGAGAAAPGTGDGPIAPPVSTIAAAASLAGPTATVNVGAGVQVRYRVQRDAIQDDVVVTNARSGAMYQVQATLPAGVTAQQTSIGINFVDNAGAVLEQYLGGLALDAVAQAADDVAPPGTTTPVTVTLLNQTGNRALITVGIDPVWLGAPTRVFPVVIDPTATTQTNEGTDDLYLNSDNPYLLAPTGGSDPTAYVGQSHLRLGDKAALGTARIFLPFDLSYNGDNFYVPPGDVYANGPNSASLALNEQGTQSACAPTYGVDDIATGSWAPANTTWVATTTRVSPNPGPTNGQPPTYPVQPTSSSQTSTPLDGWQPESLSGTQVTLNVSKAMAYAIAPPPATDHQWAGLVVFPEFEHFSSQDCWREFDSADYSAFTEPKLYVTFNTSSTSPPPGTSSDNGQVPAQSTIDDPVDVATGNLKEPVTDLTSPSGVYGLDWTRTYNLLDSENGLSAGGLGLGWSSSYYPTIQAVTGGVSLTGPDGRQVTWRGTSAPFTRPSQYPADLSIVGGNYRVTFNDSSFWDFDSLGRLAMMTGRPVRQSLSTATGRAS